ncbi:SUN domain-containing protein 1-like isoform X2 [Echeneis naucrates]|uniref:SUN domain-containing protein 1-like isoform X2 n=1 Tax=Echeneis naucrates TaxID=173247 RepID=UPI0011145928|nr:SUN domain-containing protein 1-like isoform X2 [Echeneis naucrates]
MSRRSLRLDDGLLDRGLPYASSSFSVGEGGWRNSRSLKSRRSQQHSVSCSESLLVQTPRKASSHSLHNSSIHSLASDASLLSSLLDESSIQETTLVDTIWGLDHDPDPKESTIIAEQSSVLANSTLLGSDSCCPKHPVQASSRVYCRDCELHLDRTESTTPYCSSSKVASPMPFVTRQSDHVEPETPTIYCRDRSRKSRKDVLQLFVDWSVISVQRAAASCVSALTNTWQVCQSLFCEAQTDRRRGGGAMRLKELNPEEQRPNGSLCGDCKVRHCSVMDAVPSSSSSGSSLTSCVLQLMWSTTVFTASGLCGLTRAAASALWPLAQRTCLISRSAAGHAGEAFRLLGRRWCHVTTSSFVTRFSLQLLVLLLLLFCLCWFGPAGLQSVLQAVNVSEWRMAVSDVPSLSYSSTPQSQSTEGTVEEEPVYSGPVEEEELARLLRLEQSLMVLWEQVEVRGRRAEQRHREILRLYTDLQQQLLESAQRGERGMMEHQLSQLRKRLDEERRQREQVRQQDLLHQRSRASRLHQLERQLQALATKMEELQWRQAAALADSSTPSTLPAAVSVGVDWQSHDALLTEVARLEAALGDIRRDVKGLTAKCSCQRLQGIEQRVREELWALVYGNQLASVNRADSDSPSESLVQWLSQQYVSGDNLQAVLASLELRILQNITLQLEQQHSQEAPRKASMVSGATMTQEDVHVTVANALRLFSEDRTGLADYALESGGGSILSTRCSETYETKAALLSLFGVPLWYFSQSPRTVIQPDVHPGNCWAFRGSSGFLVIRLSMRILPTAFSLEHIPKSLAPSRTLSSAPRQFSVYGLEDEDQETGKLLGAYTYNEDGDALQTFAVTVSRRCRKRTIKRSRSSR